MTQLKPKMSHLLSFLDPIIHCCASCWLLARGKLSGGWSPLLSIPILHQLKVPAVKTKTQQMPWSCPHSHRWESGRGLLQLLQSAGLAPGHCTGHLVHVEMSRHRSAERRRIPRSAHFFLSSSTSKINRGLLKRNTSLVSWYRP